MWFERGTHAAWDAVGIVGGAIAAYAYPQAGRNHRMDVYC